MSLTKHYQLALQQPDMVEDKAQEQAIAYLESLSNHLATDNETATSKILKAISNLIPTWRTIDDSHPIQGMYLWGGVGRGKTWLMNMFYDELVIKEKTRIHFHHFMLKIHEQLTEQNQRKRKKQKNPLQYIAKQLARDNKVLCIDEFIVTNITDATILSELLHALFKYNVYLVATSNRIPDDLYLNGLQRDRFIPAIELIKKHMNVFHLDGGIDFRMSLLEQSDTYYTPITDNTSQQIAQRVKELTITPITNNNILNILKRNIQTIQCSKEIAWFSFSTICSAPRAAQDYIELAQRFNTIIITNIPVMDEYSDDKTRRFIYLIDELYDRNVKLIASADTEPDNLYQGRMLEFAFNRTSSRLIEMRSHQYLSKAHKPF